jgi:hypothetical protein
MLIHTDLFSTSFVATTTIIVGAGMPGILKLKFTGKISREGTFKMFQKTFFLEKEIAMGNCEGVHTWNTQILPRLSGKRERVH